MSTLIVIIGLLIVAAYFYHRAKSQTSLSVRLGISQNKPFMQIGKTSAITRIGDPVVAAATLLFSIESEEFVLGDADEEVIENLLLNIASQEAVTSAIDYAKWAVIEVNDANFVIERLGKLLSAQLDKKEKIQLLEMTDEANFRIGGCYDYSNSRARLAKNMGLEIAH
ncbi:MAG: hypothetical protein GY761_05115 [Hyphomicrobiales bacterium]|nr:hypothetical protein [Hyphomicrobiales bacterium]